jgi:hypothetical protein
MTDDGHPGDTAPVYYCTTAGGILGVKPVGRGLSRIGEIFSGVEKWISGLHYPERKTGNPLFYIRGGALRLKTH